jgi:hypothetical protein
MKYNLKKLKQIVCKECLTRGCCSADVKCNNIMEIEKIFHYKKVIKR